MKCPNCGVMNHESAQRCDCGYDFVAGQMQGPHVDQPAAPAAVSIVPRRMLPAIAEIARQGAALSSAKSLGAWGVINLLAWLTLGWKLREFLNGLSGTSDDPTVLLLNYGVAVIAGFMLFFAAVGALTRVELTVLLDGLTLLVVGLWNIGHDFIALSVLFHHGYSVNPSVFWIMLGLCQLIWGFRQLSRYGVIVSWPRARLSTGERENARSELVNMLGQPENAERGIIKGTRTIPGPLGFDLLRQITHLSGKLTDDCALFVSRGMDDYLCIERSTASRASYGAMGVITVEAGGRLTTLSLGAASVLAMKRWAGVAVSADDLKNLGEQGTATMQMLSPYLDSADTDLRAAAVAALGNVAESPPQEVTAKYLEAPEAKVRAAAAEALKQPEIRAAKQKAVSYFTVVCRVAIATTVAGTLLAYLWARSHPLNPDSIEPEDLPGWAAFLAFALFVTSFCGGAAAAPAPVLESTPWLMKSSGVKTLTGVRVVLGFFALFGLAGTVVCLWLVR